MDGEREFGEMKGKIKEGDGEGEDREGEWEREEEDTEDVDGEEKREREKGASGGRRNERLRRVVFAFSATEGI